MFAGNEASADAVCLKGEAFRSAAVRTKARQPSRDVLFCVASIPMQAATMQ